MYFPSINLNYKQSIFIWNSLVKKNGEMMHLRKNWTKAIYIYILLKAMFPLFVFMIDYVVILNYENDIERSWTFSTVILTDIVTYYWLKTLSKRGGGEGVIYRHTKF